MPAGLGSLNLNNLSGLTWAVGASAPVPAGLGSLTLNSLSGLTWAVGASAPMPAGLTSLNLNNLSGLTWEINASYPWPVGATAATIIACDNVTCTAWTDNAIRSIQWESSLSQAKIATIIDAIRANKANFTWVLPSLDIAGGSNAVPDGVLQDVCPPTSTLEKIYDLVHGNCTPDGPEWAVTYQT